MADTEIPEAVPAVAAVGADTEAEAALGDPGKRALDALRAENKALRAQLAPAAPVTPESAPVVEQRETPEFEGTADSGARMSIPALAQIPKTALARMKPAEIEAARKAGRLRDVLSGK